MPATACLGSEVPQDEFHEDHVVGRRVSESTVDSAAWRTSAWAQAKLDLYEVVRQENCREPWCQTECAKVSKVLRCPLCKGNLEVMGVDDASRVRVRLLTSNLSVSERGEARPKET